MNPGVRAFAQVAVIIVGMVASLAAVGVVTTRVLLRRKPPTPLPDGQIEERLERLQQSVDAIAIEVERVAEAQRFSAKLLAERSDSPSLHLNR